MSKQMRFGKKAALMREGEKDAQSANERMHVRDVLILYFTLRVRKVCQSEYDRACTPSVVSQSRYHSHVMVTSE